ncbi:site-specific integrase [Paraburkholderia sp. Se-20369]|nr:site-specific integrase [Paraburkholderia sp. Se-20369]
MTYLADKGVALENATEESLQRYRACLVHSHLPGREQCSTATANLRVTVVALFHTWAQKNEFPTPLGTYLQNEWEDSRRPLAPRRIRRHPQLLSADELTRIFHFVRQPYKLAFRWALTTGMRRFEVAGLQCTALPSPEALLLSDDGLVQLTINRKGGTVWSVYAPVQLIEETHWHILTDRHKPLQEFENTVFVSRHGRPLSRQSFSREFRRCANFVGSGATMHHLRHTYAVNVLKYLDTVEVGDAGSAVNSLKTLQVLMGHERAETTEIYLSAISVSHPSVVAALGYLYGVADDV